MAQLYCILQLQTLSSKTSFVIRCIFTQFTLNNLCLLSVVALRFAFYTLRFLPVPRILRERGHLQEMAEFYVHFILFYCKWANRLTRSFKTLLLPSAKANTNSMSKFSHPVKTTYQKLFFSLLRCLDFVSVLCSLKWYDRRRFSVVSRISSIYSDCVFTPPPGCSRSVCGCNLTAVPLNSENSEL